MTTWKTIWQSVLIAACSGSLGFGVSQASMGREVQVHTIEIRYLKQADERSQAAIETTQRLVQEVLTANRELVQLIRLQNQIKP